jgi:hypothetical protein
MSGLNYNTIVSQNCNSCSFSPCNCADKTNLYCASAVCYASGYTNLGKTITASASSTATSNISQEDANTKVKIECNKVVENVINTQINLVNIAQDFTFPIPPFPECPEGIYPKIENKSTIDYYNTKSIIIENKLNYVCIWQGLRYLGNNSYLICGTSKPTANNGQGIVYIGNINGINGASYLLNVPNPRGGFFYTSVYGPNYNIYTGLYTFVGSYNDVENSKIKGFIYRGDLSTSSLINPSNFTYFNNLHFQNNNITFLHSVNEDYIVGNTYNNNGGIISDFKTFVWNFKFPLSSPVIFSYPNSTFTTSYGIIRNYDSFTIVGGFSNKSSINFNSNDIKITSSLDSGFLVNYDNISNTFNNFTPISYKPELELITHFEGVDVKSNTNTLELCAVVSSLTNPNSNDGYYLLVNQDVDTKKYSFNINDWIKINYQQNGYSTANSVSNGAVVGIFDDGNENKETFQCFINLFTNYSATNTNQLSIDDKELLKFDNIIVNSFINYKNEDGVFTFITDGFYNINLNIYFQNLEVPSAVFTIYYTNRKNKYNFSICTKGIGEISLSTSHSLTLPSSFSNFFYAGDTLFIQNNSGSKITLVNYSIKNSIGASININKIY